MLQGDRLGAPFAAGRPINPTSAGRLFTSQLLPLQANDGQVGHDGTPRISIEQLVALLHDLDLVIIARNGPLRL
jgi:hypothetical protein